MGIMMQKSKLNILITYFLVKSGRITNNFIDLK